MAFQRNKALASMSSLTYPLVLHILYCFFFREPEERQCWLAEIRSLCNRIHLLTILKKGRLKEQDLMEVLYDDPLGENSLYAMVDMVFCEKEQLASPVSRQDFLAQAEVFRQQLMPLCRDLIRQLLQPVWEYRSKQCMQTIQAHWDYFVRSS
jgi:hypothetical protein